MTLLLVHQGQQGTLLELQSLDFSAAGEPLHNVEVVDKGQAGLLALHSSRRHVPGNQDRAVAWGCAFALRALADLCKLKESGLPEAGQGTEENPEP